MTTKKTYLLLLTLVLFCRGYSQLFPVQATTQLVPPYSVYLPDYTTGINNQLRVLLLNKDVTQPGYKVKLKMTIELNGSIIMRTSDYYNPAPITIEPNQPYSVEGTELAPYLNSNNIDFIGYSKQEYEQKKGLPEGAYKICFTAYDYVRPDNVKVSNEACSYYYLSKNDPPFVNMPACGLFIMPNGNAEENLIEKAGRWLSYVLVIPWTPAEKDIWYNAVNIPFTNKFGQRVLDGEAKSYLGSLASQYADSKNIELPDNYKLAWRNLVYALFTKDAIAKWNRNQIKYGSENVLQAVVNNAEATLSSEVELGDYVDQGTQGNTNINFMWTPRHTSSPNSTLSTKYRLQLFAINPKADNAQLPAMANNAVLTTTPVFTISDLDATQYVYGPTDPSLIDGLQYAWRVQAYDASGRDWFKNNGYSEVCYFTFGGIPETTNTPQMEQVQSFIANNDGERRGRANWNQTGAYSNYKVRYRKQGGTGNWFEVNTDSLNTKLYDLEPNTIYQAQVQGKAGQFYGPFSAIDTFKTQAIAPPPGCGIPINAAAGLSNVPLVGATTFMTFKVGTFEFMVDSIGQGSSPGYYSGKGSLSNIPFLNILQVAAQLMGSSMTTSNGGLKVQFNNIFVNNNREVTQGEVHAISRSLEEWTDGWDSYYEERRKDKQQADNRKRWTDLDSNAVALTFEYEISAINFDSATGVITIIDAEGNSHTVTLTPEQIGHDIIVQGTGSTDQWVVRPDGTVAAVPGGGLYPGMNRPVTAEQIDIFTKAVKLLRQQITPERNYQLTEQKNTASKSINDFRNSLIDKLKSNTTSNNNSNYKLQYIDVEFDGIPLTNNNSDNLISQNVLRIKKAQFEQDFNYLIIIINKFLNQPKKIEFLIQGLKINDIFLDNFIKQQKLQNVSEINIVQKVAIGIKIQLYNLLKN